MRDLTNIVIVDVGGASIRCGTAASEVPLATFSPYVSKKLYSLKEDNISEDSAWFENAVQNGKITNWPLIEDVLKQFIHAHNIEPPNCSIIFTQSLATSKRDREKAENILFEKFKFDAVHITSDAYLSFITSGKSTGCIVQVGHSITQFLPVCNNEPQLKDAKVFEVAGSDISDYIASEVELSPDQLITSPIAKHQIDKYKEAHCYVAFDHAEELKKFETGEVSTHHANFFQFKKDSAIARRYQHSPKPPSKSFFEASEILFQPMGKTDYGIVDKLYATIASTAPAYHGEMYQHIVLSGGTAKLKGFRERLAAKIGKCAPKFVTATITYATDMPITEEEDEEGYASTSTHEKFDSTQGHTDLSLAAFKGATILAHRPDFDSLLSYRDVRPTVMMRNNPNRYSNRSIRFSVRNSSSHLAADYGDD